MGFDLRFALGLSAWIVLLAAAALAAGMAMLEPGLVAARLVALGLAAMAFVGLWRHVTRTNRELARFLEAVRFGDTAALFDGSGGAGFHELGQALNAAMSRLRAEHDRLAGELRYLEGLIDDLPVAVLRVDGNGRVALVNKAARRLLATPGGTHRDDFAGLGPTFAQRLTGGAPGEEILTLQLEGRSQRVLLRTATLVRLGQHSRVLSLQPIQETLDAVEMAAQTDLVRVLTHEILNSLTPVTSLAATAAELLADADGGADPRIRDAQLAVSTLSRRAQGLGRFIEAYRAVARPPQLCRQDFAAKPWADELARVFTAQAPGLPLALEVAPVDLELDADPDLLAQVLINLLKNAAQALEGQTQPRIALRLHAQPPSTVIEVQDNGPGVPSSLRGDVFLPFFTTRATGTGVGLNLARQIVVAHGGSIDVLDAPGGGALFRIVM